MIEHPSISPVKVFLIRILPPFYVFIMESSESEGNSGPVRHIYPVPPPTSRFMVHCHIQVKQTTHARTQKYRIADVPGQDSPKWPTSRMIDVIALKDFLLQNGKYDGKKAFSMARKSATEFNFLFRYRVIAFSSGRHSGPGEIFR